MPFCPVLVTCFNNLPLVSVLFFFLSIFVDRLLPESKIENIDVITSFKHQRNPIVRYSDEHSLSCIDWKALNVDACREEYDVGVVVSFGQLIPAKLINVFP